MGGSRAWDAGSGGYAVGTQQSFRRLAPAIRANALNRHFVVLPSQLSGSNGLYVVRAVLRRMNGLTVGVRCRYRYGERVGPLRLRLNFQQPQRMQAVDIADERRMDAVAEHPAKVIGDHPRDVA